MLLPLHEGKPVCYRRLTATADLQPPVTVAPAMLSIVEGSYCLIELSPLHGVPSAFLSRLLQRAAFSRNGGEMAQRFFDAGFRLSRHISTR
ncbi:MAG: hypothetical protein ACLS7Z_12850 [Christensenellales bacterium]